MNSTDKKIRCWRNWPGEDLGGLNSSLAAPVKHQLSRSWSQAFCSSPTLSPFQGFLKGRKI